MGVFLKHLSVSSRLGCIVYLLAVCLYTGHNVYFSSASYIFLSDYRLVPEAVTSANLLVTAKKITAKRLVTSQVGNPRKALIIKTRTPLIYINDSLLLLDSYALAPAHWYKPESFAALRKFTVKNPYKLDAHTWCTLYYFVNKLPDWLYDNYIFTWHSPTRITAVTKYKSLTVVIIFTAFSVCEDRLRTALERIYSLLVEEYAQKTKQQKKLYDSKVWSIDARYDNRLIARCVEGEGVA